MNSILNIKAAGRIAGFLLLFLGACAPQAAPVLPDVPSTLAVAPDLHAPEIRFALIGDVKDTNVWALFEFDGVFLQ